MYPSFRSAFENLDLKGVCVKNNPLNVQIVLVCCASGVAAAAPAAPADERSASDVFNLYCSCCCWCLPAFPSFLSASQFRIK